MKLKMILSLLLFAVIVNAQKGNSENQALKQVIEDFRISIIEHDNEEKFNNLFLHESITWATIYTAKSKASILEKNPNFKYYSSDFKSFYKNLLGGNIEEKFYNVKIDTRDKFATISFDYTFAKNSKIQNWGVEYWSLMKVEGSWKITSVTWTMNLENIQKCPFVSDQYFILK